MLQHKIVWPFGKSWYRKSHAPRPLRTRLNQPFAAQVEFLEQRALLSVAAAPPAPVNLGAAGTFAVLAASAVNNAGPSAVSGDVGVSPGNNVSGFGPGQGQVTNGTIHVNDAVAAKAHADLGVAYNYAKGEAKTATLTGVDLGGMTLPKGVYFFASSVGLTGTLTLDGNGDPNAEFIFQIGSTLTTASNSAVVMIRGADPAHVFWQVGSSATLGTGTAFQGNILAAASITVTHGSSITNGSALALNGGVTLDDNAITDANAGPILSGLDQSQYYVQGTAHIFVAPNLVVTEPHGGNLTSATVVISNWQNQEDQLDFYNSAGLNGVGFQHTTNYDANTGAMTLTITGAGTAAQYQTVLRTVSYWDPAGNPNTAVDRVANITVNDPSFSASASETLSVFKYLSGTTPFVNFMHGSPKIAIVPMLIVTPPKGVNIMSATVVISNWQNQEDQLDFYNTAGLNGIGFQHTKNYDPNTGKMTLTITGAGTAAQYQTVLRSVTYWDPAGIPNRTTRSAKITVNDGTYTPSVTQNITVTG